MGIFGDTAHDELKEAVTEAIDDAFDIDYTTDQLAQAAMDIIADWLSKGYFSGCTYVDNEGLEAAAQQLREPK